MITLHGIPNCDTVKKARAWLDARGAGYRFRDFKKEPPSGAELERWAEAVGWEALLNRRGTTFRGLSEADKQGIDQAKALRLMEAQPSLIKRPVVEDEDGRVTVGFSDAAFACHWGP
jgi:Spx/MgsR family transcriptional regulator